MEQMNFDQSLNYVVRKMKMIHGNLCMATDSSSKKINWN